MCGCNREHIPTNHAQKSNNTQIQFFHHRNDFRDHEIWFTHHRIIVFRDCVDYWYSYQTQTKINLSKFKKRFINSDLECYLRISTERGLGKMNQKQKTFFILFIELLFMFSGCLILFSYYWFPGNGGFTRNVLFIHSDPSIDSHGYFLFVDELSGGARKRNVDFLLHGRGSLSIVDTTSATFQTNSYTSSDVISIKTSFLSPITSITQLEGGFYPDYRREYIYHSDNTTKYIKAKYSAEKNSIMGSVIYPHNDSDVAHPIPAVSGVLWNQFGKIGSNDLIYYQEERNQTTIYDSTLNATTDAKILFIHQNSTDGIDYYYADCVTEFSYEGVLMFESNAPITVLVNYHNITDFITGYVHLPEELPITDESIHVKIRLPFDNPTLYTYIYEEEDSSVEVMDQYMEKNTFESFSFAISTSPLTQSARIVESSPKVDAMVNPLTHTYPDRSQWEISQSNLDTTVYPYLLLNATELTDLQTKISTNQEPWKSWYNAIITDVDTLAVTAISEWDEDERYDKIEPLIIKYAIDGGQIYLDKIKEILLDMEAMNPLYEKDLRRSYALQAYSVAYDLIRADLTPVEQDAIEQLLYDHSLSLTDMRIFSDNNHRCVDGAGLGMVGLVLKNKQFVDIATETILTYLYEKPRNDGGSYEGQSYLAFALHQSIVYMQALNRVGGYDFFKDSKYLACLDFMAHCLSPLGTEPLFEDTYLRGDAEEVLLIATPRISNTSTFTNYPNYFQWLFETRQNNSALTGLDTYYYLRGSNANLRRLALYNPDYKINATIPNFQTDIYTDTNMAFFREQYGINSVYLALSCKNFMQSHPHYDENSFELWGYGAWLIHNPGYPNFGKPGHDYTISTEASNTLLINGQGQKIPQAKGFTLTITSPYFDVVKADATLSYNSPGSWISAWAVNGFMFLTTALIGITGIILTLRNAPKNESDMKRDLKKSWKLFETRGNDQIAILRTRNPTRLEMKWAEAKENFVNFGVLAVANIFYFSFVIARFEFYMAYSDNTLNIVIPFRVYMYAFLLILPVLLVYAGYRGYVNAFTRNVHRFLDFEGNTIETRAHTRKAISRNFLVHLPWFVIASIVLGITVVKDFIKFESILFETVGGVGETIYYLFEWLQNYAIILGILLIVQIPFTYVSLRRLNSELSLTLKVSSSPRWIKLKTLTISFLLKSIYIAVYFGFFLILFYLVSLIGIEML